MELKLHIEFTGYKSDRNATSISKWPFNCKHSKLSTRGTLQTLKYVCRPKHIFYQRSAKMCSLEFTALNFDWMEKLNEVFCGGFAPSTVKSLTIHSIFRNPFVVWMHV